MRRKPKTESRQRNNQSLNTVGVPRRLIRLVIFSISKAFYSPRVYEYAAAIAFPKPASRIERVPTIFCLRCESN
jgi:hypothetical protein